MFCGGPPLTAVEDDEEELEKLKEKEDCEGIFEILELLPIGFLSSGFVGYLASG